MTFEEALRLAVRWLGYRDRPAGEIGERLRKRGAEEEIIARVLEHLRSRGWLDDGAWAERWVSSRVRRGWGRGRLVAGLMQQGLPRSEAEAIVFRLVDLSTEVEQGLRILRRRRPEPEAGLGWHRAISRLQRRGFSGESLAALRRRLEEVGLADLDNQGAGE
ncbi:MAG: regulatory protein RecX [Moorellales bacterium]